MLNVLCEDPGDEHADHPVIHSDGHEDEDAGSEDDAGDHEPHGAADHDEHNDEPIP